MKKLLCILLALFIIMSTAATTFAGSGSISISPGQAPVEKGMKITKIRYVTLFTEEATVTELDEAGWYTVKCSSPVEIAARENPDGWNSYEALVYSGFDAKTINLDDKEFIGRSFDAVNPIRITEPGTYLVHNFLSNIVHGEPRNESYIILFVGNVDTGVNTELLKEKNPITHKPLSEKSPSGLMTYIPGFSNVPEGPGTTGASTPADENQEYELKSFSDVPAKHWAYEEIMLCAKNGAINGTSKPNKNGVATFSPKGEVSLGQFLAVVTRFVCPDKITTTGSHWATGNYNAAVATGIIKATDFGSSTKDLNASISREDMAYILVNAAKVKGETLNIIDGIQNSIIDFDKISADRTDSVLRCYSNGLITGLGDGSFAPDDTMTREQMAVVLCRLMEYVPRAEVTTN